MFLVPTESCGQMREAETQSRLTTAPTAPNPGQRETRVEIQSVLAEASTAPNPRQVKV